jgi:hypothetical protein
LFAEAKYFQQSSLCKIYISKQRLTSSQIKRFENIRENRDQLYWMLTHSICSCPICGSRAKDMGFVFKSNSWLCIDCLKEIS